MGELFKVEVDRSTARLVAVAASSMGGCTQFFPGWTKRFGNPPIIFTFPMSERAPEPRRSNHPQNY